MTEKDIENLIARNPERFFPNQGLELVGQQISLGRCRVDILFKDKYKRTIIVEVKRGVLDREAAGQIMEYYGLLKQQCPSEVVELILCANIIPAERKMFLENTGIECKEIGVALISKVAEEGGYRFLDEYLLNESYGKNERRVLSVEAKVGHGDINVWVFQANPNRYDILNALSDPSLRKQKWQVNQNKEKIKEGHLALIWMSGKEAGIYAVATITSDPKIQVDFPWEERYWLKQEDKGKTGLRVTIEIIRDLRNHPVFREDLRKIPGLEKLSILRRFPQGTNFPVKSEEWKLLQAMIK